MRDSWLSVVFVQKKKSSPSLVLTHGVSRHVQTLNLSERDQLFPRPGLFEDVDSVH